MRDTAPRARTGRRTSSTAGVRAALLEGVSRESETDRAGSLDKYLKAARL